MNILVIKALTALAASLALFGWGWRVGAGRVEARWSAQRAADQVAVAGAMQRAAEDGTRALERVIRERDTIAFDLRRARDELQYVPPCPIPPAAVRVHDLAAGAVPVQVPEPPVVPDGGAAPPERGAELSTLLKTVNENYRICREDQARLSALQGWVRDVAR